ncbi:unnamed protein product [Rotaria sp. Silwood2]|nr:unnamed protein product [Rotaria sp. Silwood2]CAF4050266.1 unnamed protein product [Rotaria sp. Silwood2]CAF4116141.1 unnamed protein product [Rotaria sp. Silwood2]
MADTCDTEEQRIIDRIKCIAFREARDAGATFINRHWVAKKGHHWTEEDFLHLAPSDEFFVWVVRRPNYQNDRIWAISVDDIEEDEHYREMIKNQACIGIFVIFTAKRLHWVIKDKGESWTGQYFRDIILTEHVFPFLKNEENVIDPDEVVFVHDKAPCMRAYQTHHLLQDNDVKFWGNNIWLGNSPDLNVAEHIGIIIKDEVEKKMLSEPGHSRYFEETLKMHISDVLKNMQTDTDLFETLLCSYPSRLRAVKNANGRHTDY